MKLDHKNLKKYKDFFQENGFLHLKSVIKKDLVNKFIKSFFIIFNSYSGLNLDDDLDSSELVKKLKEVRNKDKKNIDRIFRSTRLSSSFNKLFFNEEVLKVSSFLLGVDKNTAIISEFQFRIDEPKDRLYTLDWHQDGAYYNQDKGGLNSIVINICVQDCFKQMGSPEILKNSHKNGLVPMRKFFKNKSNSLQYKTSDKFIKNKNSFIVEPKVGDIVIYDMNLIHKSGYNSSKKARFSLIGRAFNPLASTFRPFYFSKRRLA